MDITHAYAATVTKAERDAAGDLIVYGKATGPDVDLDAQICDPAWLKTAMPQWMTWGNLREMHQPIAAGIGIELAAEGDDWMLKSKVVDDGTAKKIEAGALKGYSVGIKNAQVVKDSSAPGGRIIGGEIVEVSYVDRPCNPTATLMVAKAAGSEALAPVDAAGEPLTLLKAEPSVDQLAADMAELKTMFKSFLASGEGTGKGGETGGGGSGAPAARPDVDKRDFSERERERAAESGSAMPDGSFPIKTRADVQNAVHLAGQAKDPAAARKHIVARAKSLGASDLIPDSWTKTAEPDTVKTSEIADLVKAAVAEATKPLEERAKALEAELAKVKATPIPGGPVIRPTATTTAPTGQADKAAYYRQQADQTEDPIAREGFLQLAAKTERGN